MNILKLQDQLKNVPDQSLIGYVQNPTGQVPTYLALTELQRRKEMRNKYQTPNPEQKTVAEDLTQPKPQGIAAMLPQQPAPMPSAQPEMPPAVPPQGMAEGGLAGLDTGNMYNEQNFATGGIVAFADGGDTSMNLDSQPALNLNKLPSLNVETGGNYMTPDGNGIYAGRFFKDAYRQDPNPLFKLFSRLPDSMVWNKQMAQGGEVQHFDDGGYVNPSLVGGPVQESLPWYSGINDWLNKNLDWSGTNRAMREKADKGWPSEVSNPFISGQPRTDIMDEYLGLKQKVTGGKGTYQDIERMKQIESQGVPPVQTPGGGGYVPGQKTPADIQADLDKQRQLAKDKEKAIKDIYAPKGGTSRESTKSLADYAKEFRDVVGEDPMRAKLMERMDKMDAAAAKQAEQAPWMALAQAGFGMAAGKSPFALQNIAAGAIEGVKSYGDARDKLAALEEKRFTLVNDMAKAQRAEQLAIASKGVDSRDAQLAREQQERINDKKMANDMQIHLLDNVYNLEEKKIAAAAKDQPDATARATKIWPLVPEQPEYKDKMKALINKLGDEAPTPGTRNHNKYLEGRRAIENEVYNNLIRKPGMGTTGATYTYVPGKGIMPL